jgi:hypothetical protein
MVRCVYDLSMRKKISAVGFLIFSLILIPPAVSVDGIGYVDSNEPAMYSLDKCATPTSMNCIESVGLVSENGDYSDGALSKYDSINKFVDSNGNTHYNGRSIWIANGKEIGIFATLDSLNSVLWKNSDTDIQYGSALRVSVNVEDPLNTKVRISVRTSWIRPQSIQLKMMDSEFKDEIIPGGHRWTVEGKGLPHSSFNYPRVAGASKEAADYDGVLFDFFVHHAGVDAKHGFWPPVCADQGYTVQTNNTNETGEPTWDFKEQTLQFGIFAPHLTAAGKINNGYFKFWTTDKFLNCKFPGNALTKAANLSVQILDEDGTPIVATTQISHANGEIKVLAAGFHFSSPKIVIRAANTKPLTLIKCQKSKVIKVVTGRAPVCPKGYQKVK